jgi:IclR family mhp operon transcriptional activator
MLREPEVIAGIRAAGYATHDRNPHSSAPGRTSSIAVPIRHNENLLGCLTMVYFSHAMPMERAVEAYLGPLRESALAIAQASAQQIN